MKGKKRRSNLVFSILILGLILVLLIILFFGTESITKGIEQETDKQVNPQIVCSVEVEIKIIDVCMIGGGYQVTVENNGKREINRIIARFYESRENIQTSTDMFSSGIGGYSIKKGTFYPKPGLNEVKVIEMIPEIKVGERSFICSGSGNDYGSFDAGNIIRTC